MGQNVKTSWKKDFELPVGVSLSTRRQVEVMTAKLGSTPKRNLSFRCESYVSTYDDTLFLGQSVAASAAIVFSTVQPRIAKPNLLEIESNQITFRLPLKGMLARSMSEATGTYLIVPRATASCRLVLKMLVGYHYGWRGRLLRLPARLALSNFLRRELLEIKQIAESPLPVN